MKRTLCFLKDLKDIRSWAKTEAVWREQQVMQNCCAANLFQTSNLKNTDCSWVTGAVEAFFLVSVNTGFCQVNQALYLLGDFTLPPICAVGCSCPAPQHTVLHCWRVCLQFQWDRNGAWHVEPMCWVKIWEGNTLIHKYLIYRTLHGLWLQVLVSLSFLTFKHEHFHSKENIWE